MPRHILILIALLASPLHAADWPQFLGPKRNGVADEQTPIKAWSDRGPPIAWQRDVGPGYAGPVVSGERLILFHRVGDEEVVEAINAATGKGLWKFTYSTAFEDDFGKGNGPRSTPSIAGKNVVTLGADGWLHCLDLETGTKRWGRNILKDYVVPRSYFGIGTSPLVVDGLVLVNVGAKDAGIVAFELDSGKEKWKATSDGASYASPILAPVGDVRHAIFFTRLGVVLLDPKDGKVHFTMRWRPRIDASVNAATPLVIGERIFVSTSYETGALVLKHTPEGAEKLWDSDELMTNHYNTCVAHRGFLFGFDGRQEAGPSFKCVDLKSKKALWSRPRYGCGTMVLVDDKLILLTERGDLVLIEATPLEYKELARAHVFDGLPCRAQLAFANGKLYARDQGKLVCFDLK